jgi:hypothetical protein
MEYNKGRRDNVKTYPAGLLFHFYFTSTQKLSPTANTKMAVPCLHPKLSSTH